MVLPKDSAQLLNGVAASGPEKPIRFLRCPQPKTFLKQTPFIGKCWYPWDGTLADEPCKEPLRGDDIPNEYPLYKVYIGVS